MFPAFGFGARVPPDWKISHEFPLVSDNSKFSFKINSLVILLYAMENASSSTNKAQFSNFVWPIVTTADGQRLQSSPDSEKN